MDSVGVLNLTPTSSPGSFGGADWLTSLGQLLAGGGNQGTSVGINPTVPQAGIGANTDSLGLGMNLGTGKMILGGLQSIGNLWQANQANKLARQQFDYTKGVTDTNLTNQIQSYNTALSDRATARAFTQGDSAEARDDYIRRNSLANYVPRN